MTPTVHAGSWAEVIVVPEGISIVRKPDNVDVPTASAASLAGITAVSAVDALTPAEGGTLLVIGATGGVGSVAVELAAAAGATVIAPALPEDEPHLRGLGVADVVPPDGDLAPAILQRYPAAWTRSSTTSPTRPEPTTHS